MRDVDWVGVLGIPQQLIEGPVCYGMQVFSCNHHSCNTIESVDMCDQHGLQQITDTGSGPGFYGTVYRWTLGCGCQKTEEIVNYADLR